MTFVVGFLHQFQTYLIHDDVSFVEVAQVECVRSDHFEEDL